LRHQLIAAREQEKSTRINGVGLRVEQRTILASVQGGEVERIICGLGRFVMNGEVEKVLAVGQEKRPAM
jgi:hypothetical protein